MTCPKCFSRFEGPRGVCPQCGVSLFRNVSGIVKTSVVMISAGEENVFYDSVQDVPERLRKQLIETTASANSGTHAGSRPPEFEEEPWCSEKGNQPGRFRCRRGRRFTAPHPVDRMGGVRDRPGRGGRNLSVFWPALVI